MKSPKKIAFTKMQGLGNDFVVMNALTLPIDCNQLNIKQLADRHLGIGFDQLLLIEPSQRADFFCRIINADGSDAEQCGNGLRCVARFLHENGLHTGSTLTIETLAGIFPITIHDDDHIRVTLGAPSIEKPLIELALETASIPISIISTGNPHAIVKVTALDQSHYYPLSRQIAAHASFPNGVNVGFMQIINHRHALLRTVERGAGETLACGSNACAAAVAGILNGWLENKVTIEFCLGSLAIEWEGEGKPIHMTGPATRVFTGELSI